MNREHAPDFGRGFLRIPLSVWADLYCLAPLTRRQLQLVSVVIRESWGWQKPGGEVYCWTRPLPAGQLARATGLSTDHLTRDLKGLVSRGVLREEEGRYQLVADPGLWKTLPTPPPKPRSPAPNPPATSAKTALLPPDVKTAKIRQRNVLAHPGRQLSTTVDNSPWRVCTPTRGTAFFDSVPEARFCEVVTTFAGHLEAAEVQGLHRWINEAGVATVWEALGPSFQAGPAAVRAGLRHRLHQASGSAG
jgi:replication protein O